MNPRPASTATRTAASGPSAPWLAMVHGATHDHRYFDAQVRALEADFRILLVDLPGHGDSAGLPGPFGFEEHADAVLAGLDAAGIEATHYLGTHTGAAAALMLACRHPDRFLSLALEGPPLPGGPMPSVEAAYGRAARVARSRGMEAARRDWYENGPWFDNMRAHPERCRADAQWEMLADFAGGPWLETAPPRPVEPVLDRLDAIRCPVLVFNGEHDAPDFLAAAEAIAARLPDARRVRIPGAGGFPMWEAPDAVLPHLRRHLGVAP